jgi:hypothetical protein
MNIRKTITSEIEWNTIKKAQADGKLQELLQVGDELDITLKTGEELTVQAVGTTEHGLIFLLKDCMKDEHGMNKRMTNKGGWRDSEMRLWLNETIIHMLPDELREMIVPRRIVQTMDGERLESEDKLWLPSFTEMFGKENAEDWAPADTDETQLELFSTERSRVKEKPGERYMVVLAPLSEWQQLHVFLRCLRQRQRRLLQRERGASGVAFGFYL